jgi:hypothetical protein
MFGNGRLTPEHLRDVTVSHASHDAQVFINAAANRAESLSNEVSKTSALDFGTARTPIPNLATDQSQLSQKARSSIAYLLVSVRSPSA